MGEGEFSIQGYNIVTLLKRLETATSRLEDVTIFQENAIKAGGKPGEGTSSAVAGSKTPAAAGSSSSAPIAATAATAAAPALQAKSATPTTSEVPKAIKAYDELVSEHVDPFVALSEKIDPVVAEQAGLFKKALLQERQFLWAASLSKKVESTSPAFMDALKPINATIMEIGEIKESNRTSKFGNNLSTVAEGSPALGWICYPTPVSVIPDFKDAAQFWSNRILKEFKGVDETQVAWAKSFSSFFDALKSFVKEHETTGPVWNARGGSFTEELKKLESGTTSGASAAPAAAPAPPAGGPAPPPPPPPPASVFVAQPDAAPAAASSDGGMSAVFSELNKGEGITKGLKKVEKSQMTHKNPALRASSPAVSHHKPVPPRKPKSLVQRKDSVKAKPPKKELVDNKWEISNYKNSESPIVIDVTMDQSVFISNCDSTVVQITGKANAVTINSCKKVGVVVEKGISTVDVIKSTRVELQILDHVPTISADQTDTITIYLPTSSLDTEIFTSATTSLNVEIPDGDDMKELPAPEQLKHVVDPKTGKLVSTAVEHSG